LNPALSATAVAAAIRRGAVPIGPIVADGRVDAARTLSLLPSSSPTIVTKSLVVRARLTRARPLRQYVFRAADGMVAATLMRSDGPGALELVSADGRVLARANGKRRISVAKAVAAGAYTLRVRGAPGRFTLAIRYPALR
jgi:hypothetical protein